MAVSQPVIKAALLALYNDAKSSAMTETDFADQMATIIKNAITSGTVNSGITVQVDPVTGTGATTGTGTIS